MNVEIQKNGVQGMTPNKQVNGKETNARNL